MKKAETQAPKSPYMALYRTYRPQTLSEVVGQDHVTTPLHRALENNKMHHAYLLSGPRGCGKTSTARILARSLNCEQGPTPDPCGVCESCIDLSATGSGSIDVIELDAASHGGVDDTRDLRERAMFGPAKSRYKVYIIDEAHMISPAGFNALLKLVEEPLNMSDLFSPRLKPTRFSPQFVHAHTTTTFAWFRSKFFKST